MLYLQSIRNNFPKISDMDYPVEGVTVEELEENEVYKRFLSMQLAYERGFVRLMPYQQLVPKDFIEHAKTIKDFKLRLMKMILN